MDDSIVRCRTDGTPSEYEGLPTDDPLRVLPRDEFEQLLDGIVDSWPATGLSEHLSLEVAAAFTRGRLLASGVLVPGCACERCTGISAEAPAWTRRTPTYARRMQGRASWETRVDQARAVTLLEVVQRLGLGTPAKTGKELAVCCPLHKDNNPSLRLNPTKQLWYCAPCAEGGDGIRLCMRARRIAFAEAVRELAR